MPAAEELIRELTDRGYADFTGVPCSMLKGIFKIVENPGPSGRIRYFPAPREDTALGVASGLAVAGRKAVVLMQNSGLANGLNVLTSFNLVYEVRLPLVVSWRGSDPDDAVEHRVIGRELPRLLDLFGLVWNVLDVSDVRRSVDTWLARLVETTSVLVVREGI
ncbi:thiamine pyrophosphate-binding protein [Spirillospora sp. NPDC046719]